MDMNFQDNIPHIIHLTYGPHKCKAKFWNNAPFNTSTELLLGDFNFVEQSQDAIPPRRTDNFLFPWEKVGLLDLHYPNAPHTRDSRNGCSRIDRLYGMSNLVSFDPKDTESLINIWHN